jgi:hypothetical protein
MKCVALGMTKQTWFSFLFIDLRSLCFTALLLLIMSLILFDQADDFLGGRAMLRWHVSIN